MGKMNVAYSDIFENLEAVINTDSDKPALSRVYDVSQSVVNKFKLNQIEEKDVEYNDFIKQTQNNLEQQRKEQQRKEQERLEQERLEKERLEQERLEQKRLEQERLEQQRKEKERERLEQQRKEQERLEQERLEQERLEQERLEQERLEQQRKEKERLRLEKEKLEQDREKEKIDRIYQKLKINTVKSTPVKTDGTKSLTNKLSNYYQKNQPKINNDDNNNNNYDYDYGSNIDNHISNKKLIISNIKGEKLYEKLININEQINFNSVNLPSQYQHEQIDSIKFDKDKNSNDIINIIINKKDVDIKKVIYRKIIPVDENHQQLAEPIIQSIVFRGKYNIENDQNQWISQDLKFDEIHNLPIIHGKSCDVDIIQPLTINVQAYENKHEINTNVIYRDMYDLIDQDKDYEVIFMSQKSLNEIDRMEHMIIKCGYVRNIYTDKIYPIRITSHNQKSILDQINKNSKYRIKDFDIKGNRLIAYINDQDLINENIDKNKQNEIINSTVSQQIEDQNLNSEITNQNNEMTSKYKPVKKEIKDAFNKVDIPKAYQYNQYLDYKAIDHHINDMKYYYELNDRYINQFLKHINLVRKELKLPKMKKFDLDLNEDYQLIESLLKTNQNIVDNNISDTDTKIIDFCKEYMNKNNSVFDFIPLQRKVGVNSKLSPEYLADRDFEQIIKRINQFKEHRELAMDREINHIIRNKSYLLVSLFIKDIYDLNQSKANNKIAYNYSTIKIYS